MKDVVGGGWAGAGFVGLDLLVSSMPLFWTRVSINGVAHVHALNKLSLIPKYEEGELAFFA